MSTRSKILWLPGWYPSRTDFLDGDFTERHAKAASIFNTIVVLYVKKDKEMKNGSTFIDVKEENNITTYIAYYNAVNYLGFLSKIISVCIYYKMLFKLYNIALKRFVSFDLVHVHISLRQGLLAQWILFTKKIKYVITEQNSWFMPGDSGNYTRSFLLRIIISTNFKNAKSIHVVSDALGKQLKIKFPFIFDYHVIPNVVDTDIFNLEKTNSKKLSLNFFAINGNVYHKNTDGIIRAFAEYLTTGPKAVLHIAGSKNDHLVDLVHHLGIKECVVFYGFISNKKVAEIMKSVDLFIFFSRFETFGCVFAEANCCGVPVIASDIAVLRENLLEGENALFVNSEDEKALSERLIYFSKNSHLFNSEAISANAIDLYSYEAVGRKLQQFYAFGIN